MWNLKKYSIYLEGFGSFGIFRSQALAVSAPGRWEVVKFDSYFEQHAPK
jgi:hypothetical protein